MSTKITVSSAQIAMSDGSPFLVTARDGLINGNVLHLLMGSSRDPDTFMKIEFKQ